MNTMMDARRGPVRGSTRSVGREWRGALWLLRHPGFVLVPALLVGAWSWFGWGVVAATIGGTLVDLVVWARVHPASFDRWLAPWLRAWWRRWTAYRGRHWAGVLADCELVRENRRTGEMTVPRVLRVRSATRSIDTLYVRMARGQDLRTWTDRADALAAALFAHRVAITKVRPAVLAVVVEREMPFPNVVPAPEIPGDCRDVDLSALDVGDNEHGAPFLLSVVGKHVLTAGASGAGKGSLIWAPLRAMGPLIRDGQVRVSMIDLKGGAETDRGRPLFARYAATMSQAIDLLSEVRDAMKARQELMRTNGVRTLPVDRDTPLELVMIDELAMLTAYGDRGDVREALRLLAEILTQGRACLISVMGYVQEPSKDVIDVRELFTTRVCLGVTAASHVDMVLGDGARERGALADEIPGDPGHAGIGFVIDSTSRLPVRFRAAFVTDAEIDELVERCHPWARPGDVVDMPLDPFLDDEDGGDFVNSLRDNSEYRLIMTVICVACGLGAVGSVVPLVEQAITALLIGVVVVAVWVASVRLIARMIREHLEDLEDERTAAAWRAAHQPAASLQEVP